MECKICNKELKNKIALNIHLRTHNISILEYLKKYENLKIPKCKCGKFVKQKGKEIKFLSTCGNKKCIKLLSREKRLIFMKENPEKTAWRLKNLSYPEKIFKNKCEELNLNEKYLIIRERPVFPYFIDFAFENEKIAVEIDGSQHENKDRKKRDKKKDKLLIKNGWKIIRFPAVNINNNIDECIEILFKFIYNEKELKHQKVGIFKWIDIKKEKKIKDKNGFTELQILSHIKQRKVERPSYKVLVREIKENGYSATGRKYGVSDNAIRNWIKKY